eukprot:gene4913-9545_t
MLRALPASLAAAHAATAPIDGDRAALWQFYKDTNGAAWDQKDNWGDPGSPCRWYGVTCGGGRVKELDLIDGRPTGAVDRAPRRAA